MLVGLRVGLGRRWSPRLRFPVSPSPALDRHGVEGLGVRITVTAGGRERLPPRGDFYGWGPGREAE